MNLTHEQREGLINAGVEAREAIKTLSPVERRAFENLYRCDPMPATVDVLDSLVEKGVAWKLDDAEASREGQRYAVTTAAHMARSVCFDEDGNIAK